MGRNNICVIYDSDENYAKRLMSVINDDNDIPIMHRFLLRNMNLISICRKRSGYAYDM